MVSSRGTISVAKDSNVERNGAAEAGVDVETGETCLDVLYHVCVYSKT